MQHLARKPCKIKRGDCKPIANCMQEEGALSKGFPQAVMAMVWAVLVGGSLLDFPLAVHICPSLCQSLFFHICHACVG